MENIRGAIIMAVSMLGFAIEDMFIKQMAGALHVGQIICLLGLGGGIVFGAIALIRGDRLWSRDAIHPYMLLRNLGEVVGTIGFVTALALSPLSTASAILQANPLLVTLGAAVFFGEPVGWRRWMAIGAGLVGVMLVIQPGTDGFVPASLFAVQGVVGLSGRDLASRRLPRSISSMQVSTYAFITLVPVGLILLAVAGEPMIMPDATDSWRLFGAMSIGIFAYYGIVIATRIGDIAAIAPFRYTRIVYALVIAAIVFGETPNGLTLIGAAIIVISGVYTLLREARLRRASLSSPAAL